MSSGYGRRILRAALVLSLGACVPWGGSSSPSGPGGGAASDVDATDRGCAVLTAELPKRDSMVLRVPRARCGPVRLSVAGEPRSGRAEVFGQETDGDFQPPWRPWAIPVVLTNEGDDSVAAPLEMRVDSVTPLHRGTRVAAGFRRAFVDFLTVEPQGFGPRWRFTAEGDTSRALAPGESTGIRWVYLKTRWFTRGFRIAFESRNLRKVSERRGGVRPFPRDTASLGPAAERLLAEADLPEVRARRAWLRLPGHDLFVFGVAYGEPHDCPAGCFYSSAVGLQLDGEAGWIAIHDYERDTAHVARLRERWFELGREQAARFSPALVDSVQALTGARDSRVLRPLLGLALGSLHVRTDLLVHLAASLYARRLQGRARLLAEAPAVRSDPEMLTLLGDLPPGGPPYETVRRDARSALREMASRLLGDPDTPRRTLFLLAQTLERNRRDSALIQETARHPRVRDDPAILTVLEDVAPSLRPRVVASVKAPAWARELLDEHLAGRHYPVDFRGVSGDTLLRDRETRSNRDVLSVLANRHVNAVGRGVVWDASRRLPRNALRRWEPRFVAPANPGGR